MLVEHIEFRMGGVAARFDNGSVAHGTFKVINGRMHMLGFDTVQQQSLEQFIRTMDSTALLDPRLDFCSEESTGQTAVTDVTNQDPTVGNSLIQWNRADSITGASELDTVIYWPALIGDDGLSTTVTSDLYTGGGKLRVNYLNTHSVIETAADPIADGKCAWDDWNSLQIGTRPVIMFFVAQLGGGGTASESTALNFSNTLFSEYGHSGSVIKSGFDIRYLGGILGWQAGHWTGETTSQFSLKTYSTGDTNWHVYVAQYTVQPTRQVTFYIDTTLKTPLGTVTNNANYPEFTEGMTLLRSRNPADFGFRGRIAEFRIYDGTMDDDDRTTITNALLARYGL